MEKIRSGRRPEEVYCPGELEQFNALNQAFCRAEELFSLDDLERHAEDLRAGRLDEHACANRSDGGCACMGKSRAGSKTISCDNNHERCCCEHFVCEEGGPRPGRKG